ncbi:MAG: Lrp/AsnC ligand binding domain-containing protein [Candidatus Bathyarchaeia archaeon]
MATAFVLLNAELGAEIEVLNGLKMIDEVKETHLIYGVYDIIARIEADTMDDLRKVIGWNVRRLTRVRSTITMICL